MTATFDDKLAISFDASNISIPTVVSRALGPAATTPNRQRVPRHTFLTPSTPPQDNTTADVLGIPVHPLLKAEIVPRSIEGFLERRTGKAHSQRETCQSAHAHHAPGTPRRRPLPATRLLLLCWVPCRLLSLGRASPVLQ